MVTWAGYLGWLNLSNSLLAFMGSIISALIFSFLALFELFLDLQPSTPKRTAAFQLAPAFSRVLFYAAGSQSLIVGAILGAVGGVIGAFACY